MAITTKERIEAVLNRNLTATEEGFLPERLVMLEGAIVDAFPGLALEPVTVTDEDTVVGNDMDVWPAAYPLVSVSSLTVNGAAVDLTDLIITDPMAPLVLPSARFSSTHKDYGAWRAGDRVVISYTAGYDGDVPEHVSTVAAEMIATAMATPLSVRQETLGDHSVSYAGGAASSPEALRHRLRRLARRVTSIPMHKGTL